MSGNGILGPNGVPLAGAKPKLRVERIFVGNLVAYDPDGEAELTPQEDITMIELYKINLLMYWILGNPPIPVADPTTNGRTGMIRALQWRQFIVDEELGRHFTFRMRADQHTEGNA